ncbi:hypothetical protein [Nocardia transvalensis]|uniref:hypothetical protein n=1 Tax=Nocardia transvalensis TaxID=37333 RepID=UPI001893F232|nr:hypothetical protein [Nocardia transvalensis]MBF6332380.1 hypothetical protein [Nocardia transvalensis]
MLIYAAPGDLVPDWLATVPDDVAVLIRYASIRVTTATRLAVYGTDSTGKPTDPDVRTAMRDAVCAQVAEWVTAHINPVAGPAGQPPVISSQSVPGGSVTYATGSTQQQITTAVTGLCDTAYRILLTAGLITTAPRML